ncbi:hypothetical protein [Kocuria sabuli]|uniref:hypothetical protein n=1 Tax=Kocuria sabuli TaxID=3071448 RepID=UPI0034D7682F
MELTIAEAAVRLGVTPRQAQRLAEAGRLQVVRRVGRTLLVEDTSVTALARDRSGAGRRWNGRTAWAAIELLEHGRTDRVTGSTASRLRRRLPQLSADELMHLATDRAQTMRLTQTRRRRDALEAALMLSGRSALAEPAMAARFGLAGGDTGIVEGYVLRENLAELQERFGLMPDAEGEVLLRVADQAPVAGIVTSALDLAERGITRERSPARAVLQDVLAR